MKVLMFGWEFPPKIYGGLALVRWRAPATIVIFILFLPNSV